MRKTQIGSGPFTLCPRAHLTGASLLESFKKKKLEFPPPTSHSSDSHDGLDGCPESQMMISLKGTSQMINLTGAPT